MRILMWNELFLPHIGGVEIYTHSLLKHFINLGHECAIITSKNPSSAPDTEVFEGIHVYRFDFNGALASKNISLIARIISSVAIVKRKFKPNIFHVNSCQPSIFFHIRTRAACNVKSVLTIHQAMPIHLAAAGTFRELIQFSDWVTSASSSILKPLLELIPELQPRHSVIDYGLPDTSLNPCVNYCVEFRALCIGRLVFMKGFDLAIEAFREVTQKYSSALLVIIGDGPERAALEKQALDLGISKNVLFLGQIRPIDVYLEIDRSMLVLAPSRESESFGLVALQAAQRCRPVIAADVDGLRHAVINELTGLLVKPNNPQDLANGILRIFDNPDLFAKMGSAGKHRADREFSIRSSADKYLNLYLKLLRASVDH